jgi:hypothetical protein
MHLKSNNDDEQQHILQLEEQQLQLREQLRLHLEQQQLALLARLENLEKKRNEKESNTGNVVTTGSKLEPIKKKHEKKRKKIKKVDSYTTTDDLHKTTESSVMTIQLQTHNVSSETENTIINVVDQGTVMTPRTVIESDIQTDNAVMIDSSVSTVPVQTLDIATDTIPIVNHEIEIQTDLVVEKHEIHIQTDMDPIEVPIITIEPVEEEIGPSVQFEEMDTESSTSHDSNAYTVEDEGYEYDEITRKRRVYSLVIDTDTDDVQSTDENSNSAKSPFQLFARGKERISSFYKHVIVPADTDKNKRNKRNTGLFQRRPVSLVSTKVFFGQKGRDDDRNELDENDPLYSMSLQDLMKQFNVKTVSSLFNIKNALDSMEEAVEITMHRKNRRNIMLRIRNFFSYFRDVEVYGNFVKVITRKSKLTIQDAMGQFGTDLSDCLLDSGKKVSAILQEQYRVTYRVSRQDQDPNSVINVSMDQPLVPQQNNSSLTLITTKVTVQDISDDNVSLKSSFLSRWIKIKEAIIEETSRFVCFPHYKGARKTQAQMEVEKIRLKQEKARERKERRAAAKREREERQLTAQKSAIEKNKEEETPQSDSIKLGTPRTNETPIKSIEVTKVDDIMVTDETDKEEKTEVTPQPKLYSNGRILSGKSLGFISESNIVRRFIFRLMFSK